MVILCTIRLRVMKSIIDRVLELQEDEGIPLCTYRYQGSGRTSSITVITATKNTCFGCGGCGSNTVARLEQEGLFDDTYVRGNGNKYRCSTFA